MNVISQMIRHHTKGNDDVIDLTDEIQAAVQQTGIRTGQLTAMVVGSTAALSTVEFEPGLVEHDIAAALERIAPRSGHYEHEKMWHDDNGHSHVRATLIGPSIAFPIIDGRVPLGTWQQIVLLDFDTGPRTREVVLSVIGE